MVVGSPVLRGRIGQHPQDRVDRLGDGQLRSQLEVGRGRRLVWIVDAREVVEPARIGLGVHALGITFGARLERGVDEDLDELQAVGDVLLTHQSPDRLVGRHERDDRHRAGVGKQAREVADSLDIAVAVGPGEPEIAADPSPQLVAVEQVGTPALLEQAQLERRSDRRLASARESGEPHGRPLGAE